MLTSLLKNSSILLLKKIVLKNSGFIDGLQRGQNLFEIQDAVFSKFLASPQYRNSLQIFEIDQKEFGILFGVYLEKHLQQDEFCAEIQELLANPTLQPSDLDFITSKYYQKLKSFYLENWKKTSAKEKVLLRILVSIKLCLFSDNYFPYLVDPNDFFMKFSWESFRDTFDRSTENDFRMLL